MRTSQQLNTTLKQIDDHGERPTTAVLALRFASDKTTRGFEMQEKSEGRTKAYVLGGAKYLTAIEISNFEKEKRKGAIEINSILSGTHIRFLARSDAGRSPLSVSQIRNWQSRVCAKLLARESCHPFRR